MFASYIGERKNAANSSPNPSNLAYKAGLGLKAVTSTTECLLDSPSGGTILAVGVHLGDVR